ncbi:MAG: zinc-ribbon domain-containing protein [Myxococcales bacterium]|nr:zinc-ribbon domain-containing protein [Myxococcales bacterium]
MTAGARASRKSLAERYPRLAREWHPTRNRPLTPGEVAPGSAKRIWWRCSVDPTHVWRTAPYNRTSGSGCPMCSGRVATPSTALAAVSPELAREWHPTANGDLRPCDVRPASNRRVRWRCREDHRHEWDAPVNRRSAGIGCPYCAGRRVAPGASVADRFPDVAAEWHPSRNVKQPSELTPGSQYRAWWRCRRNARHVWQTAVVHRTTGGQGCPICSGRRTTPATSLAGKHPKIAREWHPVKNGSLQPTQVSARSHQRVWWLCSKDPQHEWQRAVSTQTAGGALCPFCSGRRVSPTNSLAALRPDLAREWHPTKNGKLGPASVTATAPRRVWWRCQWNDHHVWSTRVYCRSRMSTGCPFCAGNRPGKRKKRKRVKVRVPRMV